MEIILCSGRLNFSQTSNRKLNHDLHIVHNCLHGGAPKANGPRISVDSFIIIIRPFHLLLPASPSRTNTYIYLYVRERTYTYMNMFSCLLLFLAPPFLPLLNSIAFRISHEAAIIMATNLVNG